MKNIFFLISRSLFIMIVSLYTTRILYNEMGAVDYGIFGLILGITTLVNIFTNSFNNSFQRFFNINYQCDTTTEKIYLNSIVLSFIFAFIIIFLLFALDVYLIEKLNIPPNRLESAKYFSYLCIANIFFSILKIPFISYLSASLKINLIVISSIVETLLKLIFTIILIYISYDNLVVYGFFILVVTIIILLINYFLVKKFISLNFERLDRDIIIDLFKFSLTNSVGNFTPIVNQQALSVEVNYVGGAMGSSLNTLASQVNASFVSLMGMMHIVYAPIITKQYIEDKKTECIKSIYKFTNYIFIVSLLIIAPIFSFINFLLFIWLGSIPASIGLYVLFYLLISLVEIISAPLWIVTNAEGKIFKYQVNMLFIGITYIPLGIIFLIFNFSIIYFFISLLVVNLFIFFYRIYFINSLLNIKTINYLKNCIFKPLTILVMLILLGSYLDNFNIFINYYLDNFTKILILESIGLMLIYYYILDELDKEKLKSLYLKMKRGFKGLK